MGVIAKLYDDMRHQRIEPPSAQGTWNDKLFFWQSSQDNDWKDSLNLCVRDAGVSDVRTVANCELHANTHHFKELRSSAGYRRVF